MVNKANLPFPQWNTPHAFSKHSEESAFIHSTADANPFALPSSVSITAVFPLLSEILILPQAQTLLLLITQLSEWQLLASEKQFES